MTPDVVFEIDLLTVSRFLLSVGPQLPQRARS